MGRQLWEVEPAYSLLHPQLHDRLDVVSTKFEAMPMIQRHKLIYGLLDEEIKAGVHALTMSTKTPAEAERAAAK